MEHTFGCKIYINDKFLMKKLLLLLFSILISFNSYADWTRITDTVNDIYYVDKNTVMEHNGYIFWWELHDLKKPAAGYKSAMVYMQGDCGIYRYKGLEYKAFNEQMGRGEETNLGTEDDWRFISSGSAGEVVMDYVCDYIYY